MIHNTKVLSTDLPTPAKQEIINRIKSIVFVCMYCTKSNPIPLSVVDFEYQGSGPHASGFFICPECSNKFMVKIEDLGKIQK